MHDALMTNEALLTSTQAGTLAECSSSTIRRAAENGELEIAHQLPGPNGPMLFREADVLKYKAAREAAAVTA